MPSVFDAYSEPHVRELSQPTQLAREQVVHPLRSLGQHLEHVPACLAHHLADARNVGDRHALVKEIAHRVHENLPRRAPPQWLIELLWYQAQVEPLLERVAGNAAKPLGECLGITVLAAGADLRTPADRVPGGVRPLDPGAVAHEANIIRRSPRSVKVFNPPPP